MPADYKHIADVSAGDRILFCHSSGSGRYEARVLEVSIDGSSLKVEYIHPEKYGTDWIAISSEDSQRNNEYKILDIL